MDLASRFSYACNQCGRCCHDKVITLSPYDVIRIARAAAITSAEVVRRYTIRRGSILKFEAAGCVALVEGRCTIHRGRPLACRLYPLGMEWGRGASGKFVRLDAAAGSRGVYADNGTVGEFLSKQGVDEYFAMNARYAPLLEVMRERVRALADFEKIEPREFWRRAVREALAETNYDPNPLIDAMFDPDGIGHRYDTDAETVKAHVSALDERIRQAPQAETVAAAAVMLAVSLGYAPREVIDSR